MLKMSEITSWDDKAIDAKLGELKKELFELRMKENTSGLEKPHMKKELKQDIARLNTVKASKGQ